MCFCKLLLIVLLFSSCDDGWLQFNDYCLAFSPEELNWYIAASICQVYGARLVQIDSQAKQDWIVSQMQQQQLTNAWTGGSNRYHNTMWTWVPSLKLMKAYTNWHAGEPNNFAGENPSNGKYRL
ncbi:unnamed protein product, partial [Candidula unifasciata]